MYSHICETDFHSIVKLRIMDTKHIGYYKMMRTKESSRKAPGAQTMRLNSFPPDVGVLLLRKYTLLKYKQMQTQVAISNQPPPLTRFCSKSTRPRDVRTMDLSSQWWNATLILRIFFFFVSFPNADYANGVEQIIVNSCVLLVYPWPTRSLFFRKFGEVSF